MNPENVSELQREWFRRKLAAEKSKNDVVKQVQERRGEFVLLDARDRASYEKGHIPGALSLPLGELAARIAELDRSREYVAYCWNAT